MEIQEIIVALLFVLALLYIGQILYKTIRAKQGCGSNCKCGVDFSDIKIPDQGS
jgi:hypothetical protein